MDSIVPADSSAGTIAVAAYIYRPLTTKHRRAGSTGTTGDEEYTTDEEELYAEEAECPGGTNHPILKSDLARAATDLFGYEAKDNGADDDDEDDDDDDDDVDVDVDVDEVDENVAEHHKKGKSAARFVGEENKLAFAIAAKRYCGHRPTNVSTAVPFSRNAETACGRLVDPRAAPKSTNPFYASMSFDGAPNSKVRVEFDTCKRPTEAKPEVTSTTERCTRDVHPPITDSNPFRSPSCENESAEEDGVAPTSPSSSISMSSETEVKERRSRANLQEDVAAYRRASDASPTTVQWGRAVAEVKEQAVAKLQDELRRAHEELKLKAEEVTRLSRIRQDVETELEDLTASLFQEAHNMVREANVRQATAERLLAESRMKSEVLAAEVAALKTLVLTSTPARPNPHLHPQIDSHGRGRDETPGGLFAKRHRRSPSHFNLKYGRENSPPESPVKEQRASLPTEATESRSSRDPRDPRDGLEVDPTVHKEFLRWKANPCVDRADPFVQRMFREDIDLCLEFANKELGARVRQAVLDGIVFVEAVSDKTKIAFPKKCALLEAPRQCHYRMRLGDQENHWHSISQICRNRIIAVCDFLNYLRYIERGLVKSSVHDIYWEITRLRKEMVLARLGLALSS